MAIITKYESYYNKIRENLEVIKQEQNYSNLSLAFAHWFLKIQFNMNEQEIAEAIVDGNGDNGIDAIIHPEGTEELIVLQFKFPESGKHLNKEISQGEILKTLNGFNILITDQEDPRSNQSFTEHKEKLKEKEIYSFRLMFVSFNKGILDNQITVANFIKQFEDETGGSMSFEDINKNKIANIFEKMNRKNSTEVNLEYKLMQQAYNFDDINSYMGVINGAKLIEAVKDKLIVIFDENIRLFEPDSKVNNGIKRTASTDEANMFYFFNNGIVFICDEAKISPTSLTIKLEGASIVNGCQTVNSLASLHREDKLKPDVDILVRIIKISDYDQRAKITEFLNSQTQIKDSYFISNHTIVRELQQSLIDEGYYLERQINESNYKKEYGQPISSDLKVIKLDDTIQYFTAYWLDKLAHVAKTGKGALFNKERIEEILKDINSQKVIESYEMYQEVSKVVTMYRKMRRNNGNTEFANFLNVDNDIIQNSLEEYLFVNAGDLLILNTTKKMKMKYLELGIKFNNEKLIRDSLNICREVIKESASNLAPATSAKSAYVFNVVTDKIKSLTQAAPVN
ncbi:AIPR family protein [Bacillus cereus]|nr:AIPR family protein [Bacillus cereus]